jgi:hypothetical protein
MAEHSNLTIRPSGNQVRASSPKPLGDFSETSQNCLSILLVVYRILILRLMVFAQLYPIYGTFLNEILLSLSALHHQNQWGILVKLHRIVCHQD